MSNKYKQTSNSFKAKYNGSSANPQDEWIKSENLFGTQSGTKTTEDSLLRANYDRGFGIKVGEKSAVELMHDMLRGVSHKQDTNPYYSNGSQQKLAYLLTNEYKRNNYINSLQQELPRLSPETAKNYQLLMLLLQEVTKNEIEVKKGSKGFSIGFNQKIIDNQQMLLERLRRQKRAQEEEQRRIIKQYEGFITQLHKITQHLVSSPQVEQQQRKK